MNIIEKLNNTLGYLTAMSFDNPELSNELAEPLNTLREVISQVENSPISGISNRREVLMAFALYVVNEPTKSIDDLVSDFNNEYESH